MFYEPSALNAFLDFILNFLDFCGFPIEHPNSDIRRRSFEMEGPIVIPTAPREHLRGSVLVTVSYVCPGTLAQVH